MTRFMFAAMPVRIARCVAVAAVLVASLAAPAVAADIRVFAAASLKNALDEVGAAFTAEAGKSLSISYAASSALARQIENGAPADLFISADLDWMDYLAQRGLVSADRNVPLLGNRLALIAPRSSGLRLEIAPGMNLATSLGMEGKLAMANVDAVPAGRYGKAALEALGAWEGVAGHVVQADSVRRALALVAQGEAPLGIVYATDAAAEPKVRMIVLFPADSHPPIVYPAAVLAQSAHPDAGTFFAFLTSPAARAIFERHGFAFLAPAS